MKRASCVFGMSLLVLALVTIGVTPALAQGKSELSAARLVEAIKKIGKVEVKQ
jgi:hypothetical protein